MRAKKVQMLLDKGCIIIEVNELATVLRDKNNNIATVDEFGKVTWRCYTEERAGSLDELTKQAQELDMGY